MKWRRSLLLVSVLVLLATLFGLLESRWPGPAATPAELRDDPR